MPFCWQGGERIQALQVSIEPLHSVINFCGRRRAKMWIVGMECMGLQWASMVLAPFEHNAIVQSHFSSPIQGAFEIAVDC